MQTGKREFWIDHIKVIACVLILVGHLMQGLQNTGIMKQTFLGGYILYAMYLFHVQLFFMCSGYLYGKSEHICDFSTWIRHFYHKLILLGVPYFSFAILTWLLKNIFTDLTNIRTGDMVSFLFLSPGTTPYWYLYTLFFLFVLIPNTHNMKKLLALNLFFYMLYLISGSFAGNFFLLSIAEYGFWFVLGMLLERIFLFMDSSRKDVFIAGIVFECIFAVLSFLLYKNFIRDRFSPWTILLGFVAVVGICLITRFACYKRGENPIIEWLVPYTLPIYLLHTIYAAAIRNALLFFDIKSIQLHFLLGFCAGFFGSILTAMVMKKLIFPYFFFNPWKTVSMMQKNGINNKKIES